MATLEDGLYNIRFVPDDSQPTAVCDMYATGTNMGDDVKVDLPSPGPQTWQIKRIDNTNYIIATDTTMKEEFQVAWSLQNLLSPQSSASPPRMIFLNNPGEKFALNPNDGVGEENALYSISVSSDSPAMNKAFAIVIDQSIMVQESCDIPFVWQFVPVASK